MPQTTEVVKPDQNLLEQESQERTPDTPNTNTPDENRQATELSEQAIDALMDLRKKYKQRWAAERRQNVKRVLKAFEFLKGNHFISYNEERGWYDPVAEALNNQAQDVTLDIYRFVNNIYQMLGFSFVAALSPQAPKTRYLPDDADVDVDVRTARAASALMAVIERQNNIKSLQKLELLHLWTGGNYFSYTRYVVDSDRYGTHKEPQYGMVPQEVNPDGHLCPNCGAFNPETLGSLMGTPQCQSCGAPLRDEDFLPSQSMEVPSVVGYDDVPNGIVSIGVYGTLHVDANPDAQELYETPILDLEQEVDVAAIRASYPQAWEQVRNSSGSNSGAEGAMDRRARALLTGTGQIAANGHKPTYSRCWFQWWAFNEIDDEAIAKELREKFPQGCKLVSVGAETFLEAIPEKMSDRWTWCGTIKGVGLYPPAVGDVAISINERLNDVGNTQHEYMDRMAVPTILANADVIDVKGKNGQGMPAGQLTPVKIKKGGMVRNLADALFQPTFHIDQGIYKYSDSLVQFAQLLTGVMPQVFGGGTTPGVDTATGQQQMLRTAMGRLTLFWDGLREEHASRSALAVKCAARNLSDDVVEITETQSKEFRNSVIHLDELQGSFKAYPEGDQGFPMTYGEMQERLQEMLEHAKDNPFIAAVAEDPENDRVIGTYLAPPGIKMPQEDERSKIYQVLERLAEEQPIPGDPQTGTPDLPSVVPDVDFDDMSLIAEVAKRWGQKNFQMQDTNPIGFMNVRLYLRVAQQMAQEAAAKQAAIQSAQAPKQLPAPGAPDGQ